MIAKIAKLQNHVSRKLLSILQIGDSALGIEVTDNVIHLVKTRNYVRKLTVVAHNSIVPGLATNVTTSIMDAISKEGYQSDYVSISYTPSNALVKILQIPPLPLDEIQLYLAQNPQLYLLQNQQSSLYSLRFLVLNETQEFVRVLLIVLRLNEPGWLVELRKELPALQVTFGGVSLYHLQKLLSPSIGEHDSTSSVRDTVLQKNRNSTEWMAQFSIAHEIPEYHRLAYAQSLLASDNSIQPLELSTDEQLARRNQAVGNHLVRKSILVGGAILMLMACMIHSLTFFLNFGRDHFADRLETVRPAMETRDSLRDANQRINRSISSLQKVLDQRSYYSQYLLLLAESIPEDAWLIDLSVRSTDQMITIDTRCLARTEEAVATLMSNLEQKSQFSRLKLEKMRTHRGKAVRQKWKIPHSEVVEFNVRFNVET